MPQHLCYEATQVTDFSVRAKALLFILEPFLRTLRLRSDVQDWGWFMLNFESSGNHGTC